MWNDVKRYKAAYPRYCLVAPAWASMLITFPAVMRAGSSAHSLLQIQCSVIVCNAWSGISHLHNRMLAPTHSRLVSSGQSADNASEIT